jgi:hypothetical protein
MLQTAPETQMLRGGAFFVKKKKGARTHILLSFY